MWHSNEPLCVAVRQISPSRNRETSTKKCKTDPITYRLTPIRVWQARNRVPPGP